ncbi:MAG: hypothetical protein OXC62_14705 [Aestuariivita sp.]|nr:hypothetical protein [Aestuariivita sp.]
MPEVTDLNNLTQYLDGKPAEFGCALAARIALRTAPLLRTVLHPRDSSRPSNIVLPAFCVLSALNVAGTWPERFQDLRQKTQSIARLTHNTIHRIHNENQLKLIKELEVVPEMDSYIHELKKEKTKTGIAVSALDVIMGAVETASKMIDHYNKLASDKTLIDSVVEVGRKAHWVIDTANS